MTTTNTERLAPATADLTNALAEFVAAQKKAAALQDSSWSDSYLAEQRKHITDPAAQVLTAVAGQARAVAQEARQEQQQAFTAAMTSTEDSARLVAREMAWTRVAAKLTAGSSLETLARQASTVELEAIMSLGAFELGRPLDPEDVAAIRARHHELTGSADPSAEDQADQLDSLASTTASVMAGQPLTGGQLNAVYGVSTELYAALTAE